MGSSQNSVFIPRFSYLRLSVPSYYHLAESSGIWKWHFLGLCPNGKPKVQECFFASLLPSKMITLFLTELSLSLFEKKIELRYKWMITTMY